MRRRRSAAATFRVGGMAKGSGMIEPMMATMLGFVTTDAAVPPALLQRALRDGGRRHVQRDHRRRRVLDQRLRVALANGASGVDDRRGARIRRLLDGLRAVCRELALGIVRGGEGATKLVTVTVTGARVERRGAAAPREAIANSPLVKTAMHGGDPNWGRLVAVAGRVGRRVRRSIARAVPIGPIVLFEDGRPLRRARAARRPST